jgi:hypothetical protein
MLDMQAITNLRLEMYALGMRPVPVGIDKIPHLKGWRTPANEQEIRSWADRRDLSNTGSLTAFYPCADFDIMDAEVAEASEHLWNDTFGGDGEILYRTGQAPKWLTPFRTGRSFKKRALIYKDPSGKKHRLEILADGQQAVFFGYNGPAHRDYVWRGGRTPLTVPPNKWPEITEAGIDAFLDEFDAMVVERFGWERDHDDRNGAPNSGMHVTDVTDALANLSYQGHGGGGNMHDTLVGCINRMIVDGSPADDAVETVFAILREYAAASRATCERLPLQKMRRRMTGVAYSFINKYPDFAATALPPRMLDAWVAIQVAGNTPRLVRKGDVWAVDGDAAGVAGVTPAVPLTAAEWLARKFPPRDTLLGAWATTTSRIILSAPIPGSESQW